MDKDLLDFAEKQGADGLRFSLANAEALDKDCNGLLTLLLAGMGAMLAYVLPALGRGTALGALEAAAGLLALWWMVCGVLLMLKCINSSDLYSPANDPVNLVGADYSGGGYTGAQIRQAELPTLQKRLDLNRARSRQKAKWLDCVRCMVLASPMVGLALAAATLWAR